VIGCVTLRDDYGYRTVELLRELIKNNPQSYNFTSVTGNSCKKD
jgi:hypothetical protein